jgi:hypothetical protein
VASAEEYRAYADECFGWARTAKTKREREIFIQMAQTWLAAAGASRCRRTYSALFVARDDSQATDSFLIQRHASPSVAKIMPIAL